MLNNCTCVKIRYVESNLAKCFRSEMFLLSSAFAALQSNEFKKEIITFID